MVRRPRPPKPLSKEERLYIGSFPKTIENYKLLKSTTPYSRETIWKWLGKGKKVQDKPRPGRPRKVNSATSSNLRRSALKGRTATQLAARLSRRQQQRVSTSTVRRILRRGRDPLLWLPIRHGRTLSASNQRKRHAWCQRKLQAQTRTWVFIDAKYLYLYKDERGYLHWCWQSRTGKPPARVGSNPWVFFFYGAVAHGRKSKLLFTVPSPAAGSKARRSSGTFKSSHFVEVMQKLKPVIQGWFPGSRRYTIIMDRAKQHTSKQSVAALKAMKLKVDWSFPAQCWDLNIIENVWGVLDTKLQQRRPKSTQGWRDAIRESWNAISQSTIDKLVDSVKARMRGVVKKEGAWLDLRKQDW